MKAPRTWFVLANQRHARIVENDGPSAPFAVLADQALTAEPANEYADQPGRSFSSVGARRSGMEPHHNTEAEGFALQIADALVLAKERQAFDRLVICAGPDMLGQLRQIMPDQLKPLIAAELAKDLVNIPAERLREHLENAISG